MTEQCSKCWSEDIVYNEWLGAYDGVMSLSCKDCGQSVHLRSGLVILKNEQKEAYGPVTFYLEGGEVAINNRIIWNEKQ